MRLGTRVHQWRWGIIAAWVLAAVLLAVFVQPNGADDNRTSFLPADSPYRHATTALSEAFPGSYAPSQAVVIAERHDRPMTGTDIEYVNRLAQTFRSPRDGVDMNGVSILSPGMVDVALTMAAGMDAVRSVFGDWRGALNGERKATQPIAPPNPLRSRDKNAVLIRVNIPGSYLSRRSAAVVDHLRQTIAENPPPQGLSVAVTGTAGFGHDYAVFVRQSHDTTVLVTLVAVVTILLLVYRAPLAALAPILAVSVASVVVLRVLDLLTLGGAPVGLAERIFVFVLMYGAGIDYSLLLLSRYQEELGPASDPGRAIAEATDRSARAIAASAGTDAAGILMLSFSQFLVFQTTGPAVAIGFAVAMLASLTLVPALAGVFGRGTWWPRLAKPTAPKRSGVWPKIATWVTQRPWPILLVTLAILAGPAWYGTGARWQYDALAGADTDAPDGVGNAAMGVQMAGRHWVIGELTPVIVAVRPTDGAPMNLSRWNALSRQLVGRLEQVDGVGNVRTFSQPLGRDFQAAAGTNVADLVEKFATTQYISPDWRMLRVEVVTDVASSMSRQAMARLDAIRQATVEVGGDRFEVLLAGPTAEMAEIRQVTQADFHRLMMLVPAVIFVLVLILVRNLWLTLFMVAGIGLTYLATLGLCRLLFAEIFGTDVMDWKTQVFVFVVVAAVGVDYNIFLAARLRQEFARNDRLAAIRRAVTATGPVISSCGLIMAATLGSLAVGHIDLLQQLGPALAIAMLLDTFVVRTLLLPTFAAVLYRKRG